jgi:hypothetical protein
MPERTLRFTSIIKIRGINPYVLVSATRAKAIKPGWKKPLPVLVRINGEPAEPWRINMMPVGDGSFYLYLHGEVRKASATKVGDRVEVEVGFDSDYQGGPAKLPTWFTSALRSDDAAMYGWRALSPSRQKEIVRYLVNLKSAEARARNLEKVVRMLSGKKGRFMARDWN